MSGDSPYSCVTNTDNSRAPIAICYLQSVPFHKAIFLLHYGRGKPVDNVFDKIYEPLIEPSLTGDTKKLIALVFRLGCNSQVEEFPRRVSIA